MKKNFRIIIGGVVCLLVISIFITFAYFKKDSSEEESEIRINLSKESIDYNNKAVKKIIKRIKKEDSSFNKKEYKLLYNNANEEEGFGYIFLKYYINNKIETSKEYLISINNNIVDNIELIGVPEKESSKVNENSICNRVEKFEKEKKKESLYNELQKLYGKNSQLSISNILTKDNKINLEVINPKIKKYNEKYYYDYNENKLSYQVELFRDLGTYGNAPLVGDGEAIEVIID